MIKLTLNGIEHRFEFRHEYTEVWMGDTITRIPTSTVARLYPTDNPEEMIEGWSHLNPADNPNKAIGRAVALERLLFMLDREERKAVGHAVNKAGAKLKSV